jgi:ubiquinone/menaquinone biosynthesis C-methylase UbiE
MAAARVVKSKDLFPAVFSRHAAAYQQRLDGIMARGEARGRMRVIELAGAAPGMRILDLACGPGILSRPIAKLVAPGGEVIGVDLAAGMIDRARALHIPNARFEVMDIESLAFDDATFDAAVCGHGLQFAPDLGRALREARRVLKGGGRLAASVPVSPVGQSVWSLLDSVVDRRLPPAPEVVDQQPTRRVAEDAHALRQAALDAGFTSADVEAVEEVVRWESAESLVAMFMGWWSWAVRLEGMEAGARQDFMDNATATLKREYPGTIETTGRNHVLIAQK